MEPNAEVGNARSEAPRSAFTRHDVEAIARRRGWLPADSRADRTETAVETGEGRSGFGNWMAEAAQLLGARAADETALEHLLELVFLYSATDLLGRAENQAVLAREGARDVLRALAVRVLDAPAMDSDSFKEIVRALKEATGRRGPELFHPVRLALAGNAGEGDYDRVILLLDGAARLPWAVPVKNCRQRILEFCSALD